MNDKGTADRHEVVVDWDDGDAVELAPETVDGVAGGGGQSCLVTPGCFTIVVPATDDDDGTARATHDVEVGQPDGS